MIQITKNEAEYLRSIIPDVVIKKTVNKRYAENTSAVLHALTSNEYALAELRESKRAANNKQRR